MWNHSHRKNSFIRDLTLRLNALRETFEELGVLITKSPDEEQNKKGYSGFAKNFDISTWQQKVSTCLL